MNNPEVLIVPDPSHTADLAWRRLVQSLHDRDHEAARQMIEESVRCGQSLLELRCDAMANGGESVLEHFSEDIDHDVFAWLLQQGAPWKTLMVGGLDGKVHEINVAATLAGAGSLRNLKLMVDEIGTAPLEFVGSTGMTVMHHACSGAQAGVLQLLLDVVPHQLLVRDAMGLLPEQRIPSHDPSKGRVASLAQRVLAAESLRDLLRAWRARQAAQASLAACHPRPETLP